MIPPEYDIVSARTARDLVRLVSARIAEGWEPAGGLVTFGEAGEDGETWIVLCQAVVRRVTLDMVNLSSPLIDPAP